MADLQPILDRLTKARELAGLNQTQAGKLVGYTNASTLSAIERGESTLSLERFVDLCEVYGVSSVWVLTGVNPDFDPRPIIEAAGKLTPDIERLLDLLETLR